MGITKESKTKESKKIDEQVFRATFEEATVGIAHVNPEGKFIRVNKRFCAITGYSARELTQKTFQDITHPEDLGEDQDLVRQLLEGEISNYSLEKRYLSKAGSIVWVSLTVNLVRTKNGFPDYFISCIQDITERKQSEKALQDQEDSYRALIEQANDGIVLIQDSKVVYTNMALTELTGYTKTEMQGRPFVDFIEKDQLEKVKQFYSSRMKGKFEPSINESAITHKKGHRLDVEFNAGLSKLNGKSTDIVIIRDISLRKKEQLKLEESDNRFRTLYDHAGFALGMAKGGSSNHELVNQAWVDMFGYDDVSEVLGKSALDFVAPGDRDLVRKYAKLRNEGKEAPSSYEIKGLRKDGTTFDMEMRVSTYIYEDELHSIAMITDITDRKKTQNERDRFFNLSSDLISISGFDGYFKYLNPAWEDVTGFKINELLAQPFSSFLHPDDREKTLEEVKKLSQGIPTIHFENRYITKEGKIRYLSWRATPLVENQLIYSIARDVTESREAEDQIRNYQQRLKALSTELTLSEEKQRRQIAADLHDHVGQLMASSRLQLAAIHEDMEKKMILSRVKDVSNGLIAAIQATRNAIFDLSPPQLNEIGLFAAIADWMEEQVEIKHGIKAHISGDDEHYPLNEDIRVLIFRCVRELLMNVVKHSGADEVRLEIKLVEDCLNISVRDNGKGFLYNPHMLQLKSAGFGLFSIQERYSDMGGTVEIDTAPGEGTTVFLSLAINDSKE